ncbi:MAG TPA: CpsD/CapB family tyrosine-protein kinase [Kofleriaceae bacterium]|nr:CpsD/CapB family tyrosine-protein kinase [Kofleriaceae bacterium]
MTAKRPGRFGDGPPPDPDPSSPMAPYERRGAPLPLLTQPMIAVDRREIEEPAEHGSNPAMTRIDGPLQTIKLESASIALGKPTVMISPQVKPSGDAPQIDLTQHHLTEEKPDPRLTLMIDPDSERSAAFRVLRHHLLEIGRPQVVIVSSPQPGDGKTTTAVNLALALAECGRARTLLVETHVRRPQLTTIFKFVPPWCFAEQLAAHRHQPNMPWSMIDIPQLWLHVGAVNPRITQTQLLDGPAFAIAMERLRSAGYDHIVVDAPPVLGSADVNLMADAADSVVFALRARRSTTRDLRRAVDQLGPGKVAGTILLEDG